MLRVVQLFDVQGIKRADGRQVSVNPVEVCLDALDADLLRHIVVRQRVAFRCDVLRKISVRAASGEHFHLHLAGIVRLVCQWLELRLLIVAQAERHLKLQHASVIGQAVRACAHQLAVGEKPALLDSKAGFAHECEQGALFVVGAVVCCRVAGELTFSAVILAHHCAQYVGRLLPGRHAEDCADTAAGNSALALFEP